MSEASSKAGVLVQPDAGVPVAQSGQVAGWLRPRLRSHGAGSRLRLGWARRCSIRRIAASVSIASATSGSAS